MELTYITIQQAIYINTYLINRYSPDEQTGVKDPALLDSAINRPQWHYYETIHEKAAALLESLSQNHAFHNANKRTAIHVVIYFYKLNGYQWLMGMRQGENFVVDVVKKNYSFGAMAAMLNEHTRK